MLLTARLAGDVRSGPARTLKGVANHSVTFTWRMRPVTIYLNSWTHRPTMMEIVADDRPGMLAEVVSALMRENAEPPETVVGMHLTPTSWSEIEAAVRASGVR